MTTKKNLKKTQVETTTLKKLDPLVVRRDFPFCSGKSAISR